MCKTVKFHSHIKTSFFIKLVVILLFSAYNSSSQIDNLKFNRLPSGMVNSNIQTIMQDSGGFVWFGTRDGLSRFDGLNYKNYPARLNDSTSLSSGEINTIVELSSGNLLIATGGEGLFLLDEQTDLIKKITLPSRFVNEEGEEEITSVRTVYSILEDADKNIWVGTAGDGIFLLDSTFKILQNWRATAVDKPHKSGLPKAEIRFVIEDSRKQIWVSMWKKGLFKYNRTTDTFHKIKLEDVSKEDDILSFCKSQNTDEYWFHLEGYGLVLVNLGTSDIIKPLKTYSHKNSNLEYHLASSQRVNAIYEDSQRRLWVGFGNSGGLQVIDLINNASHFYEADKTNPNSLVHNSINTIFEDKHQSVWIGAFAKACVVNKYENKIQLVQNQPLNLNSLNNDDVRNCWEDKKGNIWIGTGGGGLNYYNFTENTFTTINSDSNTPWKLRGNSILDVKEDAMGNVWIGTWNGGLHQLTQSGLTFFDGKKLQFSEKSDRDNMTPNVFVIAPRKDSTIWIGTWFTGVYHYNPQTNLFSHPVQPNSSSFIRALHEDRQGNLWVGARFGLRKVRYSKDLQREDVKYYEGKMLGTAVYSILEDSESNIWVGTEGGLNLYIPESDSFVWFSEKEGLPNAKVKGIIEDLEGYLWITTNRGLAKFDKAKKTFEVFGEGDGVQQGEFNHGATYLTKDGSLYFGGTEGFNIYSPKKIQANPHQPDVVITDFKIFNKSVDIGANSPLKQNIEKTTELELSYEQFIFSFDFVALSYVNTKNNKFAYKLEGFNDDWIELSPEDARKAVFTNIDPDEYTFKVKAANSDGVWNTKGASIKITITPPWWELLWVKTLASFVFLSFGIIFYKYRTYQLHKQNALLEKQVEQRTQEIQQKHEEILTQNEELQQSQEEIQSQRDHIAIRNRELERKNRQIHDSIVAAEVIQQTILPSKVELSSYFEEYFVLFKPRDIVSGDFYWFSSDEQAVWLVVADCTGHGVPGAFMTLLGKNILDKLINQT